MCRKLADIPNLIISIDDFLIFGDNKTRGETLIKVLKRAEEIGLEFNLPKCKFAQSVLNYVGHIWSKDGVKIDPKRVEAILDLKPPKTVKQLKRFLGMVYYISSFMKNLQLEMPNLRKLLQKQVHFQWENEHQLEFDKMKKLLTEAPVLAYYDVNLPKSMNVDASKDAVGAVIMQQVGQ
ncbi:hypothetical protein BC332_34804 [Capsicum chinense]|nr:hypothetical protein BC332_34804 [Capsicum chinense]